MSSQLREQLRGIIDGLSEEANKNHDREIKERYYFLRSVIKSKQSVTRACARAGQSTDSFNRWGKRLKKLRTLLALKSYSRKPRRSPMQLSKKVERKVIALRNAEPAHGPERIGFDLKKLFNFDVHPSRIYRALKRNKLISKRHSQKLTKRHLKRYRRPLPGFVQMDIKYVPYRVNGEQYYEFNAVDHCTSFRVMRIYRNKDISCLTHFLKVLEARCPFEIVQIQTDNGSEFTDKYHGHAMPTGEHALDRWCSARGIEHRLIPVGQKELNGKVENTHKHDDREFYAKYSFKNFEDLAKAMKGYNGRWNEIRATKALGWKTPWGAIEWSYVRMLACLMMLQRPPKAELPVSVNKAKPKKLSTTGRYLQWLNWDEAQRKQTKALFYLPQISQNFSFENYGTSAADLVQVAVLAGIIAVAWLFLARKQKKNSQHG